MQQPAGCTVQNYAQLSVSHRFIRFLPVCVAFRIGFCSVFAISQLRLAFVFELCAWVWGDWGGGGDDVHATATCVFFFLLVTFFC